MEREADLSASAQAVLRFAYRRHSLDDADDHVAVAASSNGGSSWTVLGSLAGPASDASYLKASYDISTHATPNTRIRFLSSADLGGSDSVWFDDVSIVAKGCR